jgi:hypothetical protein
MGYLAVLRVTCNLAEHVMESSFRFFLLMVEAVVVVTLSALVEGSGIIFGDRWVVFLESGELSLFVLLPDHNVKFL